MPPKIKQQHSIKTTFEDHLTKQYGPIGSEKRAEFHAKAESFVIGELLTIANHPQKN